MLDNSHLEEESPLLNRSLLGLKKRLARNNGTLLIQSPDGYIYESGCEFGPCY